ncbi:MAG: hypothetical protein A2Y63_04215 [Candidatus Riflebacteria bacterium RBG_13_59_9]|nr:MAG: hypothetical protein A2Y63_04215 [Candidatus Riflebacteria bacterium RBG_13_59_9]
MRVVSETGRKSNYLDTVVGGEERLARLARLHFFARYYQGDVYRHAAEWARANGYASSVSPPDIYLNYARFLVDRLASFSFDRAMGVCLHPDSEQVSAESGDASAQFLERFLHCTRFLSRLTSIARETLLFGDVLLRVQHTPAEAFPITWTLVPAEEFDYEHDPRDLARIRFVRQEFSYYDDAGARMLHREELHRDRFVCYRDEVVSEALGRIDALALLRTSPWPNPPVLTVELEVPNTFGFIPTVHVRNRPRPGEKFGESELADLTALLDDINWKVAQRSRNISKTMNAVLKNVNGRIVSDQLDDTQIVSVIGDNAQLEYLTNDSDLAPVQIHISELKQALADLTGVVMLNPDKLTGVGAMSGFALSILYEPLLNAARAKRREIGGRIEDFLKMVLVAAAQLGIVPEDEAHSADPRIIYGPDLQFTEQEKLTGLRRELLAAQHGVSVKNGT